MPLITVTPLRLSSPPTPPVSPLITFLRRATTASKSTVGSPTRTPNSPASRASLDHVSGPQHEFGRDAGVVEAAAPEAVALDHRGAHAELRGADGGDVAAGTGADDDAVELSHDAFSVTSATCFDHWRLYQSMFCSLDRIT